MPCSTVMGALSAIGSTDGLGMAGRWSDFSLGGALGWPAGWVSSSRQPASEWISTSSGSPVPISGLFLWDEWLLARASRWSHSNGWSFRRPKLGWPNFGGPVGIERRFGGETRFTALDAPPDALESLGAGFLGQAGVVTQPGDDSLEQVFGEPISTRLGFPIIQHSFQPPHYGMVIIFALGFELEDLF